MTSEKRKNDKKSIEFMKKELKKHEKIIIRTYRSQIKIANNNCLKKFLERNNLDSITLKLIETKPGKRIPEMNHNKNDEKQNKGSK